MPMSFHRTQMNRIYVSVSNYSLSVSGFALEHARRALGVGCLRMIFLFPSVELKMDMVTIEDLKADYST